MIIEAIYGAAYYGVWTVMVFLFTWKWLCGNINEGRVYYFD
jgi:hypothetical protein